MGKSSSRYRCAWFGLLLLALSPALARAQAVQVEGRVLDEDSAAVASAQVSLTPIAGGTVRAEAARLDGSFVLTGVPPGEYELRVEAVGFALSTRRVDVVEAMAPVTVMLEVAGLNEAVTVTADAAPASVARSTLPLRDQPVTVNTLSAATLQTFAINDLVQALQTVPNVNAYNQYGVYEYYTFRGFNDSVQTIDGVRNEGNRVRTQLSNVERIEVLKGPASVLYGAAAIGATVNIVLKKPSAQPAYDGSLSFGSWNTVRAAAGATGRLAGPSVLYRVDLGVDDADNFRDDPSTRWNATPTVSWQMSSRDQITAALSFNRNDLSGDSGIPVLTRQNGQPVIPAVPARRRYNTPQDYALSEDTNLRVNYTRTLSSSFGVRGTFSARRFDDDYWVAETMSVTPPSQVNRAFLYFKHERRPYFGQVETTGRLRVGVDHDLLAGWEHQYYRTRTTRSDAASASTTPIDLFEPIETHLPRSDFSPSRYDHTRVDYDAVYVQDSMTLAPWLKAVAGVRIDDLRRRTHNNPVSAGVETEVPAVKRTSNAVTSRVGMVYQPRSWWDVFVQRGTSFLPNYNLQADGSDIEPETGRQLEVGQRLRLLAGRLDVTAAVFDIEKRNIALARPGGVYDIAGKIRSRGFEASVDGRIGTRWSMTAGYGLTDAEYVDYATTAATFSGNTRPRVPVHTFGVSSSYVFASGLGVAVNTRLQTHQFLDDANALSLAGYGLLKVNLSYAHKRFTYAVTMNNLTATDYIASTLGNSLVYPGESRRVMVSVRFRSR